MKLARAKDEWLASRKRNEARDEHSMNWLRRRDQYDR